MLNTDSSSAPGASHRYHAGLAKRWIPLESNPEVINEYARTLGVDTSVHSFHDVYSVEDWALAMVPRPVVSVLLVFPLDAAAESHRTEECANIKRNGQHISSALYYTKQTVSNACGTVAVLHAIANAQTQVQIAPDSFMDRFLATTSAMSADERAAYFYDNEEIERLHKTASVQGQTSTDQIAVDTHFVTFSHVDGNMYELDGRKEFPINHGPCSSDSLLKQACSQIRQYMTRSPAELRFTILALCGSTDDHNIEGDEISSSDGKNRCSSSSSRNSWATACATGKEKEAANDKVSEDDTSPEMYDFIQFHGMLCSPRATRACIKAFNGKILFMPTNYEVTKGLAHYEVTGLNIFTYYGLVLQSFTGLSTLLGLTRVVKTLDSAARSSSSSGNSMASVSLPEAEWVDEITSEVQSYIITNHPASITPTTSPPSTVIVRRKFEFYFGLPMIAVRMYHLYTPHDDKLHLVEIYSLNRVVHHTLLAAGATTAAIAAMSVYAMITGRGGGEGSINNLMTRSFMQ